MFAHLSDKVRGKKILVVSIVLVLGCTLFAIFAHAQAGKGASWETFRCEMMRGVKLSDLKEKLLENCNLDKPFSFTESGAITDSDVKMTYCCHKK